MNFSPHNDKIVLIKIKHPPNILLLFHFVANTHKQKTLLMSLHFFYSCCCCCCACCRRSCTYSTRPVVPRLRLRMHFDVRNHPQYLCTRRRRSSYTLWPICCSVSALLNEHFFFSFIYACCVSAVCRREKKRMVVPPLMHVTYVQKSLLSCRVRCAYTRKEFLM